MRTTLGAALACLTLAGCSHVSGSFDTDAARAVPNVRAAAPAQAPTPAAERQGASCSAHGTFSSWAFLLNTNAAMSTQHSGADGTTDSSSLMLGRQVDPAASKAIDALSGAVALLGKGPAAAATGGLALLPDGRGGYRAVPLQPQGVAAPPASAWGPATAQGCLPSLDLPGASAGRGQAAPTADPDLNLQRRLKDAAPGRG